jgi:hypothetical protein
LAISTLQEEHLVTVAIAIPALAALRYFEAGSFSEMILVKFGRFIDGFPPSISFCDRRYQNFR